MVDKNEEKRPTVLVGCKMPNGLELRVMRRRNEDYAVDGVTGTAAALEDKGFIKLKGTTAGNPAPEGFTEVDKEAWDTWAAENKDHSLLTDGTVFVQEPEEAPEPAAERDEAHHEDDERHEEGDREVTHKSDLRGDPVRHGDSPLDPVEERREQPAPKEPAKA